MSEKTCVIYARYSSHNQNDASIEQQVAECREYAKREGLTVAKVYADRAISGTTDSRPQFQQMIKDSSKKQWSIVLVWKYDRFARDRYDSANYKFRLKQNGVRLVSAKEPLPSGPEAILLESILEGSAEYYSANLAQNVRRGMHYAAQNGKVVGKIAYGYRVSKEGTYEIDPEEAEIVREIFSRTINGEGALKIAHDLSKRNVKLHSGKDWSSCSVVNIVKNTRYYGVYNYGGMRLECQPIVSEETYMLAKKAIESRSCSGTQRKERSNTVYILTGHVACGECGHACIGRTSVFKGKKYRYCTCSGRYHGSNCAMKPLHAEELEDSVVSSIIEYVLAPDMAKKIAEAIEKTSREQSNEAVIAGLKSRQKEVRAAISNILKAIEGGAWNPSISARLGELEEELKQIGQEITEAESEPSSTTKEDVLLWLSQVREGNPEDQEFRKRLVDTLVDKVIIHKDGSYDIRFRDVFGSSALNDNSANRIIFKQNSVTVSIVNTTLILSAAKHS